jgi:hypothetical protein
VEGLKFGETFAHVARFEAIRILLAFAASKEFKLYQIFMKRAFLNGVIYKEEFVRQPPSFENPNILIECTSFQRLCTGLRKRHMLGMLGLVISG